MRALALFAMSMLVGCAATHVRLGDARAWDVVEASTCDHCGGGPRVALVLRERGTPRTLEISARACEVGTSIGDVRVSSQAAHELPITIVECRHDGPIHLRAQGDVGAERFELDLRVEHSKHTAGYD